MIHQTHGQMIGQATLSMKQHWDYVHRKERITSNYHDHDAVSSSYWSNYRNIEGLGGHLGAVNDVVEKLLATAGLATWLVPGLAGWISREGATIRILLLVKTSLRSKL